MGYIVGEDREQAFLPPSGIADYVASDAAVRVIDAFADGLDPTIPLIGESSRSGPLQRDLLLTAAGAIMPA